jgi:hypothetical protein
MGAILAQVAAVRPKTGGDSDPAYAWVGGQSADLLADIATTGGDLRPRGRLTVSALR